MGTVTIPSELADDIVLGDDFLRGLQQAAAQSLRLAAENIERESKGLPKLVRYGPPAPRKAWVIDDPGYLAQLSDDGPRPLLSEAQRLHEVLRSIAGDGSGADDYYVGDIVTEACEAVGYQKIVPGE